MYYQYFDDFSAIKYIIKDNRTKKLYVTVHYTYSNLVLGTLQFKVND